MLFFILRNIIFFPFFLQLIKALENFDYNIQEHDYSANHKRNLLLKSSFCQYFNYLPICSETILYQPTKNKGNAFNEYVPLEYLQELSNSFHTRNGDLGYFWRDYYNRVRRQEKSEANKRRFLRYAGFKDDFWRRHASKKPGTYSKKISLFLLLNNNFFFNSYRHRSFE